jgi:hypothetical protein
MWVRWDCVRLRANLWKYGVNDPPAAVQRWMQAHFDRCRACRMQADAKTATAASLAALRATAVPGSETNFQDLLRRIEMRQREGTRRSAYQRRGVYVVAAATTLLMLTSVVVRRYIGETSMPAGLAINQSVPGGINKHGELAGQFERNAGSGANTSDLMTRNVARVSNVLAVTHRVARAATSLHPLRVVRAGYRRVKLYATLGWNGRPHRLAHQLKERAKQIGVNATLEGAALLAAQEDRGTGDQEAVRTQPRAYVMPVMGPGEERGVKRTYVMDGIPMTTATGQAGTTAAESENPANGRAL